MSQNRISQNWLSVFAALLGFTLVWVGIPLIRQAYVLGLTGWNGTEQLFFTNSNPLPFWLLFLLSILIAVVANKLPLILGSSFRAVLIIGASTVLLFFVAYQVAKHKGASKTRFLVGENTLNHDLVAILMSDGYGGVITRKVDPTTHQLLPVTVLFPQATSVPVLRPMVVHR